jgi:Flp pilus assembly protein TadB
MPMSDDTVLIASIVGVVGGLLCIIGAIAAAVMLMRRRQQKKSEEAVEQASDKSTEMATATPSTFGQYGKIQFTRQSEYDEPEAVREGNSIASNQ